jgi:multidrug efflux pump subunit AcrB
LVAVPVTLSLTLFTYYAMGYTLNRITLFALIFSIGILVDDAIVVVENIYRHLKVGGRPVEAAAVEGVDEVGTPTILATFTVIASILPMAFVRGMTGPYMRPIPVGASAAMLASLAVAFIVTPWLAFKLLARQVKPKAFRGHGEGVESGFGRRYTRLMNSLMDRTAVRNRFYAGIGLLLASMGLSPPDGTDEDAPFDNKSGSSDPTSRKGHARDVEHRRPGGRGVARTVPEL